MLPTLQLIRWTLDEIRTAGAGGTLNVAFGQYVGTTFTLAALAALVAVAWSFLLAHAVRLREGRMARVTVRLATLGYAMPGAVVGVGVLLTLTTLDRTINGLAFAG